MDPIHSLLIVTFLALGLAADSVTGYATVTGSVFCDKCKDGEKSWFDLPVSGIKVTVKCSDENGQVYMSREETTNWFGGYVMRFDGTPDLSNCFAQLSDSGANQQDSHSCSIASSPAQKLKQTFSFFGVEMFAADALLAQPVQPMSSCPKPPPAPQVPVKPPQVPVKPPQATSPPRSKLPSWPPLPPVPFLKPSACSHQLWTKPEHRCYWRVIGPDTKVVVAFGLIAGRRYGTDMTIRQALYGRGEAYKTLLREATTALLNSYNSPAFPYSSISVITHTNLALLRDSPHDTLMTAIRFMKANSGTCRFKACK